MKCTWKDCDAVARHPRTSQTGEVWSDLCDPHEAMMKEALAETFDETADIQDVAKRLIGRWVLAQGGAKAAAERMTGD